MFKKNSDSDYKAEDQGSATEVKAWKKPMKRINTKNVSKHEIIQNSIKNFLPQGVTLQKAEKLTNDQYKSLLKVKDAPQFSFNYKIFIGKICKVIDGDTVKAVIVLNGILTRFTFRANGIDTPQTRRGSVRQFGKLVKQIVHNMIFDKLIRIQAGQFDKYGRVLARLYAWSGGKQFCINDYLIEHDMAKQYSGKGKIEFESEDYDYFKDKYSNFKWPQIQNYPQNMIE